MKKIMMVAAVALMALAANAQNPAAVKQVLGCKSYSEANEILKSQAESMSNEERAKAYNKLVDLAISDYDKAEKKSIEAQLAKNENEEAKQNTKKLKSAYNAVKAARECDKADREPNAKGQVKPKFRKNNQARVLASRNALINGGLDAYNSKDYATATKYFGSFVESRLDPLYEGHDFSAETNYAEIAYYAALAAYFNHDYKKCQKYCDASLENGADEKTTNDVVTLKLGSYESQAQNAEIDTVKYISNVKKLYKQHSENEVVFGKLVGLYQESGDNEGANKILNDRIKQNPNDAMAQAYLGQNAQNEGKWDEAIDAYSKALAAKNGDFIQAKLNLAVCYLNRGAVTYEAKADARGVLAPEVKNAILDDFNKSKALLGEIKNEDPDQLQVKWKYQLDRVEYAIEQVQ